MDSIDIDQLHKIAALQQMLKVDEMQREAEVNNPQPAQNGSGLERGNTLQRA
jgi:hypothetical protein